MFRGSWMRLKLRFHRSIRTFLIGAQSMVTVPGPRYIYPESVTQLLNMGFPEETVKNALTKFNNVVQAAEWILNSQDDIDHLNNRQHSNLSGETYVNEEHSVLSPHQRYLALFSTFLNDFNIVCEGAIIHKEECVASFDNAYNPDGLYICTNSFVCVSRRFLDLHHLLTGQNVYLHITKKLDPRLNDTQTNLEAKPSVLGIGVPGGFNVEERSLYKDVYSLYLYNSAEEILIENNSNLPSFVERSVNSIIRSESGFSREKVAEWQETLKESTYAKSLVQLDNGVKIPPTGHQCQKCTLKRNLWLNLTDGSILCGRKQPGIVGNSHALLHYQLTKYPLCVKLGTISSQGADVYSYPEDEMVKDPFLEKHLSHFGIDMHILQKTEKTMAEYDIDVNWKHEWDLITEKDYELEKCYGPGFTGIINLGNTCYMASVLQLIFSLKEFIAKYYDGYYECVKENILADPVNNFSLQMSKLAFGLCSGEYSTETQNKILRGIRPSMFKALVGKGHPEFATGRQQDASEFYQYLMEYIHRKETSRGQLDPSQVFRFQLEEKLVCGASGHVRYTQFSENMLSLTISSEMAANEMEYLDYKKRVENGEKDASPVYLNIPLEKCLEKFFAEQVLLEWVSSVTKSKTIAKKTVRFATFPKYLLIHIQKFYADENWTPRKLPVCIEFPDILDLSCFRPHVRGDEPLLPEDEGSVEHPCGVVSHDIKVNEILKVVNSYGFPRNVCLRAAALMKDEGVESAVHWCLANSGNSDANASLDSSLLEQLSLKTSSAVETKSPSFFCSASVADSDLTSIMNMGFSRELAAQALGNTGGDVNRAIDWIFSRSEADAFGASSVETSSGTFSVNALAQHGATGKYRLTGLISHMGTSAFTGHYVCHLRKEEKGDKFVLFNDEKVAVSENPPLAHGYMYLLHRLDNE
ncbi:ubiquitin carboxyl-terminal hydrolase 5-like isoform X2 [Zophobas morio]|uniref:ubiquitin carboxyl-terminal hydrolase 5-like isoform X2 n=1 Tax=Zophobas morio TaxID=2755281 RepID=UPI00308344EC